MGNNDRANVHGMDELTERLVVLCVAQITLASRRR